MKFWVPEEDELLRQWQAVHGNRWSLVCKHLPGRTAQQVAQRWRHHGNPEIKKAKWTEEEDATLKRLVEEHGNSWAHISRQLPGRTDQQCMGRWKRQLDPSINKGPWHQWEDEALEIMVQQHGFKWAFMAPQIGDRTPQQCRSRWMQLHAERAEEEVPQGMPAPRIVGHVNDKRKAPHRDGGLSSDEGSNGKCEARSVRQVVKRARKMPHEDAENVQPAADRAHSKTIVKAGMELGRQGLRLQGPILRPRAPLTEHNASARNVKGSPDNPTHFVVPRRPRNAVELLDPVRDTALQPSCTVTRGRAALREVNPKGVSKDPLAKVPARRAHSL